MECTTQTSRVKRETIIWRIPVRSVPTHEEKECRNIHDQKAITLNCPDYQKVWYLSNSPQHMSTSKLHSNTVHQMLYHFIYATRFFNFFISQKISFDVSFASNLVWKPDSPVLRSKRLCSFSNIKKYIVNRVHRLAHHYMTTSNVKVMTSFYNKIYCKSSRSDSGTNIWFLKQNWCLDPPLQNKNGLVMFWNL